MNNLIRTLVFNGQVSLTVADTTEMVNVAIERHKLSPASASVLGKALSAMTFMSACLKEKAGEISLSVQNDGESGDIGVSGNYDLRIRGYIGNPFLQTETDGFSENGTLTIIRDDGYNRPFVGSCALQKGGIDDSFEEYFYISEQLPTRIYTAVETDVKGKCTFAGVIALQLLPFADQEALDMTAHTPIDTVLQELKEKDIRAVVKDNFDASETVFEEREAVYRCNCSREYLKKVLASVGRNEFRKIVQEDGAVKVHCHYCNTDYAFDTKDEDDIFGCI